MIEFFFKNQLRDFLMAPKGSGRASQKGAAPSRAEEDSAAPQELDEGTLERLQQQLLEDDEFAEDMRALLLARFRAKHRRAALGGGSTEDGSDASDERSSSDTAEAESEQDPAELSRLKELGYELQPHERVLSRGK